MQKKGYATIYIGQYEAHCINLVWYSYSMGLSMPLIRYMRVQPNSINIDTGKEFDI